jgi:hypothetical protein
MATPRLSPVHDITAIPRAFITVAVGVVHSVERAVVGDAHIRTARDNAWEAVCADRARAQQRAHVQRMVAAAAGQPSVGSSPRSSASQAATVPPEPGARSRNARRSSSPARSRNTRLPATSGARRS